MGRDQKRRRSEDDSAKRFAKICSYLRREDLSGLNSYLKEVLKVFDDGLSLIVVQWQDHHHLFFGEGPEPLRRYILDHHAIKSAMATQYRKNPGEYCKDLFSMTSWYAGDQGRSYYTEGIKRSRIDGIAFLRQLDAEAFDEHWDKCQHEDYMNDLLKEEYNAALEQCGMSPLSSSSGSVTP